VVSQKEERPRYSNTIFGRRTDLYDSSRLAKAAIQFKKIVNAGLDATLIDKANEYNSIGIACCNLWELV